MRSALTRVIRRKLSGFPLDEYQPIHPRALDLGEPRVPHRGNPIVAISGVRRCGKSHRLFQEMERLLRLGVPRERIGYFDFEDERLDVVTPELGSRVIDAFLSLHPEARETGAHLFLDGIHVMEGWHPWVQRLAERMEATIYLAGLPSMATPDDEGVVGYELFPYSFAEYLATMTGGEPAGAADSLPARRDRLVRYLTSGGFPEAIELPEGPRVKLLQGYATRTVLEDVVEARNFPDPQLVARFAHRVLGTNSQTLSFRRAVGSFDKIGLKVDRERLHGILESIIEVGLILPIPCFDLVHGPTDDDGFKLYAVDPGLARACARVHGNAISFLLEDAVYLELRRRTAAMGCPLRCLRNRENHHEVDFVTGDPLSDGPSGLYQVAWGIDNPDVRRREVRSILESFDEIARLRGDGGKVLPEATIIIGDISPDSLARHRRHLESLGAPADRIALVPAVDWLLDEASDA